MEENSGCGKFENGKYEGWGGAQVPNTLQRQIAETLGIKVEDVTYHVIPAGGAFGRHLFHDQDVLVATIANNDVVGYEHRMACPEMDLRHGLAEPPPRRVLAPRR